MPIVREELVVVRRPVVKEVVVIRKRAAQETRTAIFYIAETGLQNLQMGQAAAASWILTVSLMLLSLVVFAVFRARGALDVS